MAKRDESDFLDELIADYTAEDPNFPALLAEADARRAAFRALAAVRGESNISQTAAAAAMNTSQSALGRLETTATDARISTLQRYAHALGLLFQITDDLLDVAATAEDLGKTPGKDARSQKATYPALYGLEATRERAQTAYNEACDALDEIEKPMLTLRDIARLILERRT